MTLTEMINQAVELSGRIDAGVNELAKWGRLEADSERDYRKARAVAWLHVEGTAKQREDAVDAATADDRHRRDLARNNAKTALEAVRARRGQLSALQSILSAWKAEAEHSKYGPEVGP